jgi:hypothetical protein
LVLNWCLAAAQCNIKGKSFVACAVDAITEGDDDYLEQWITIRLNAAMGHHPHAYAGPYAPGETRGPKISQRVSLVMAAEVGKGIALELGALGPLQQDLTAHGTTSETELKGYSKDDVPTLMGFSGINDGHALQPIWELFNTTRGKNIKAYWCHIVSRMNKWLFDRRIPIDTSIYLEKEMIKAIVDLWFNPDKGVAHLKMASKVLSILACG